MIFLWKKFLIFISALGVVLFLIIPSGANPSDVVLDQPIELAVPGKFQLLDHNQDQRAEELEFTIALKAYRQGNFIVTGNLEGLKNGRWIPLQTSVIPFQWSPENEEIRVVFPADNLIKERVSGPYRVKIALAEGSWEMPAEVAGFSPEYQWQQFNLTNQVKTGAISTIAKARLAAEAWAGYQKLRLGKLLGVSYNYDRWQLDYRGNNNSSIYRILITTNGSVSSMKIK